MLPTVAFMCGVCVCIYIYILKLISNNIYLICSMAGVTTGNVGYLANAIHEVTKEAL